MSTETTTRLPASPPLSSSDLLERMGKAGMELAEYASYAEIVGGIAVNRAQIRKWCDEIYALHKQLNAMRSNGEVSDGGGHQTPESANGWRPPPFAPPKS